MNTDQSRPSRLGHVIDLQGRKVSDLSPKEFHNEIISNLWKYGLICIKRQDAVTAQDLIDTASKIGQTVRLPSQLAFNNREPEFPEIARVGNVAPDGTVMDKYTAAEYWHTDGNFWPPTKNYIINWLHSKIVPETGGQTAFIDMKDIYESLTEEEKEKYKKAKFTLQLSNIKDFKGIDAKKIGFEESTTHGTVLSHPITGEPALYLGNENSMISYEGGREEKAQGAIFDFAEKFPVYAHKWEEGDLLVWDNTQLMHRGLGAFGNHARLLFRAQSRVTPYHIDLYKTYTQE